MYFPFGKQKFGFYSFSILTADASVKKELLGMAFPRKNR